MITTFGIAPFYIVFTLKIKRFYEINFCWVGGIYARSDVPRVGCARSEDANLVYALSKTLFVERSRWKRASDPLPSVTTA